MIMGKEQTVNGKKYYQVSFLPWAGLKEEMKIGPITLWPFDLQSQNKIQDPKMLNHLKKYFNCYIDHQGELVDTVVICSHGNIDFRCLPDEEDTDLRSAVDILIFCTIAPQTKVAVCSKNRSMGPPSAEVFQLITQNFTPGNDHIAVRAGSVLSGGWEIGEISFPKPWATGGSFGTPDSELVEGFNKVFDSTFPQDIREQLFRSLEWFRLAHVGSDEVSPLSKVVMMATAFEILLRVPNTPSKKKWIADELEKRISNSDFIKETRQSNKGKDYIYSKVACWAWDFYELRNRIVHGDHVEPEQLRYQAPKRDWLHLIVADLVFWECIKRELFNQKCIDNNVRNLVKIWDKASPNEPKGTSNEPLVRWFWGLDRMHRALGWLKEKKMEKNQ